MKKSRDSQLILLASAWTAGNLLRENMINPQYAKKVEEMIIKWKSFVVDKQLINLLHELRKEEDEKLK